MSRQIGNSSWQSVGRRNPLGIPAGWLPAAASRPKTASSAHDVDILPPVQEALKRQMASTRHRGTHVFRNSAGGSHEVNNLRKRIWYPTLTKSALRKRTLYQTRHTFATLMLSTGENPNWVAAMMGHSTVQTLFRHYNRFIPNPTRGDGSAFMAQLATMEAAHDSIV